MLYRVWAKTRFQQLQCWHLSWLPDSLRGGATEREAADCYFQVATEVQFSHVTKHPLYGILWDYKKCFDHVAWPIEAGLLRELGMPTQVHAAMFAFSRNNAAL